MMNNDFRKPLIQSAVVLLAILFSIAVVAGSGADGFFAGIASIFKSVFLTFLFAIALTLALVISISILMAIFFGIIALHSPEGSKLLFIRFRQRLKDLLSSWSSCCCAAESKSLWGFGKLAEKKGREDHSEQSNPLTNHDVQPLRHHGGSEISETLRNQIEVINNTIEILKDQNAGFHDSLRELRQTISAIPTTELMSHSNQLEAKQQMIAESLTEAQEKLSSLETEMKNITRTISDDIEKKTSDLSNKLAAVNNDISELKSTQIAKSNEMAELTESLPEEDHFRIFNYFENDTDRNLFVSLIEEAVAKNMTYAEIDDFLSLSLPKNLDVIIKGHPSLTKDYIREIKKGK